MLKDILGRPLFSGRWVKFAKVRRGHINWVYKYIGALNHQRRIAFLWDTPNLPEDKRLVSKVTLTSDKILML